MATAPEIQTAFMSLHPMEPVLVFGKSDDAAYFQSKCKQGRILAEQSTRWVFLPTPAGLQRVRTAQNGDVAFEFAHSSQAIAFNKSIGNRGKMYSNVKEKDRAVYLGKHIKT